MKKNVPIVLISALALLIVFDAAQQNYYLTRFNLVSDNTSVSFSELFVNHLIRWCLWLIISAPFLYFIKKRFSNTVSKSLLNTQFVIFILITLVTSLVVISFHSLYQQEALLSISSFIEFFQFFFYQKGLTFLLALIGSALFISNYSKEKSLKVQLIEITELQRTNEELKTSAESNEVPHLNIKIGYKLKSIPVDEIIWIQSDDYCVKVHTKENTYTLRKSMKVLEEKLEQFRFIRIHRSALLNMDYLDQINYNSSTVRLKNSSEVPLSKTGIKKLKKELISYSF